MCSILELYTTIVGTNSAGLHTGALDNFCIIGLVISMGYRSESLALCSKYSKACDTAGADIP